MAKNYTVSWIVGAATFSALLSSPVLTAQATGEGLILEEIVVTAQRRSEDLQKTPIAVTALSPAILEERSVRSAQELMQVVPSLQVSTQTAGNGSGSATFFLRGLGQQRAGNGSQPAVGIYVDDFYYPSLNGSLFNILDLEQVEVLRGPQGTLFGRNTIGGAIRYTTKKPDNEWGGSLTATYGSFDRTDVVGVLNMPLGGSADIRLTAASLDSNGFVKRETTGGYAGGGATQLLRGQVRFQPSGTLTVDLQGQYLDSRLDGYAYRLPGPFNRGQLTQVWNTNPAPQSPFPALRAKYGLYDARFLSTCDYCEPGTRSDLTPEEFANEITKNANAVIAWDVSDTLTIKSLTGYTQVATGSYGDLDGSPLPILGLFSYNFIRAGSQELQLNGRSINDTIKWVGGVFYYDESNGVTATPLANAAPIPATYARTETVNKAAFVDVTWKQTDALSVLGGYRYSMENKRILRVPQFGPSSTTEKDFGSNTGRIGLQYQWTAETMTYLTVSQGFRSGGFNVLALAPTAANVTATTSVGSFFESFDPETSTTYELGARMTLLEDRLRLNPTLFYNEWKDIQVQRFDLQVNPANNQAQQIIHLENAGKAHTYGGELEADAALSHALHLFGNVALLQAKYDSVGRANSININSTFERAPKLTYALGATYTIDVASAGKVVSTINYNWQDKQNSTPSDTSSAVSSADALTLPSYSIANVRLEYRSANDRWSLAAAATNVFDKLYYVGGVNYPESSPHYDVGRPVEYSLTGRFRF